MATTSRWVTALALVQHEAAVAGCHGVEDAREELVSDSTTTRTDTTIITTIPLLTIFFFTPAWNNP
ncbi:MAG: hypothetical protein M3044_01220 [Thermoproteota archaeon]|nr:hypothetical protein [Thermoproteota archaeon]